MSPRTPSTGQRVVLSSIRAWQSARSERPSPCRFVPSCSAYGLEAVEEYGSGRGLWMTTRRILRCNPWGPYGFDPVPLVTPEGRHSPLATSGDVTPSPTADVSMQAVR